MTDKKRKLEVINQGLNQKSMTESGSQLDKFKQAAKELETDNDPKRFKERLAKIAKHKPVETRPD